MILDPWFYALAIPAMLIVGISKGGFGGGLGVVGVPAMSLVVSPIQAAAIMLPILCLMDLFGVWAYRRTWDRRNMAVLAPAALVGIAVGAATFSVLDEAAVRLIVGTIAIGFAADYWLRRSRRDGPGTRPSVVAGGFWGAMSGYTSFVAHAGGPPLSVYLLPQRLNMTVYAGTAVVFFTMVNYAKLLPYGWLGQFDATNLATALVLSPLAPLGMWLGIRLHKRISAHLFYQVCYGLLAITGAKLLWDGVAGYL